MSGQHFTGGEMPHVPERFLSNELMGDVEGNVVYACTDVVLRDPATDRLFLADRQTEPQIGPWLVGGRNKYAVGINDNADLQVKNDTGLTLGSGRFNHVATYSTDFPVASPGRVEHGRHTLNAVMLADLKPGEVAALNDRVATHQLRDEYSDGGWYDMSEVADPDSDFPYALKQLVRDIRDHDRLAAATHEEALAENELRDDLAEEARRDAEREQRIAALTLMYGLKPDQATELALMGGDNTGYAIAWAESTAGTFEGSSTELQGALQGILIEKHGDVAIRNKLAALAITAPEVDSDNGPALRAVLGTAVLAIGYDGIHKGRLFDKARAITSLQSPAKNR